MTLNELKTRFIRGLMYPPLALLPVGVSKPDDEPTVEPWIGVGCFDFSSCYNDIPVREIIISNPKYKAGLYDENDVRIATWEESHINVNKDYTASTCLTDEEAGTYNIVNRFPTTVKIVIPKFRYNNISYAIIKSGAFNNQRNLVSLCLPDRLWYIGMSAFQQCNALINITYPALNSGDYIDEWGYFPPEIRSIDNGAFSVCSALKHLVIPGPNLSDIGSRAFQNCISLESLELPSNNENSFDIGASAFTNCTALKSLHIPSTLRYINESTFYSCTSLETLTIDEGPTSIGTTSFYGCSILESLSLPLSITSIGQAAFYNCQKLHTLIIPFRECTISSRLYIYSAAFLNCQSLNEFYIPPKVSFSGSGIFDGIGALNPETNIYLDKDASITGSSIFGGYRGNIINFYCEPESWSAARNYARSAFGNLYNGANVTFIWGWNNPQIKVECGSLNFHFYTCYWNTDINDFDTTVTDITSVKFMLKDSGNDIIYITPHNNWDRSYTFSNIKQGIYYYNIIATQAYSENQENITLGEWYEINLNSSSKDINIYFYPIKYVISEVLSLRAEPKYVDPPPPPRNNLPKHITNGLETKTIEGNISGNIVIGDVFRVWSTIYIDDIPILDMSHIPFKGSASNPSVTSILIGHTVVDYISAEQYSLFNYFNGTANVNINREETRFYNNRFSYSNTTSRQEQNEMRVGDIHYAKSISTREILDPNNVDISPSEENDWTGIIYYKRTTVIDTEEYDGEDLPLIYVDTIRTTNYTLLYEHLEEYHINKTETNIDTVNTYYLVEPKLTDKFLGLNYLLSCYDINTDEFSDFPKNNRNGVWTYIVFGTPFEPAEQDPNDFGAYYVSEVVGNNDNAHINLLYNILNHIKFKKFATMYKRGMDGLVKINGKISTTKITFDNINKQFDYICYDRTAGYAPNWEDYYT